MKDDRLVGVVIAAISGAVAVALYLSQKPTPTESATIDRLEVVAG